MIAYFHFVNFASHRLVIGYNIYGSFVCKLEVICV